MLVEFHLTVPDKDSIDMFQDPELTKLIERSGLAYLFTPMSTIIEGDWETCLSLVRRCHEHLLIASPRVKTVIHIEDLRGRRGLLDQVRRQKKA